MSTWKNKLRTPVLGLSVAIAGLAALPAQAAAGAATGQSASRQENIGVVTGFTVGAVAGGPVGAIIGAAAGAWLGDRYHRQASANHALATDLHASEAQRTRLVASIAQLNDALRDSQASQQRLGQSLERTHDLQTDVGFRTADAGLSPQVVTELHKLGSLVSTLADVKVRVSGYADPRGSKAFNAQLSQQRAAAVAAVLEHAGVGTDRLIVEAHGEDDSRGTTGDLDGYAFERRVTIRLEGAAGGTLAQAR